jgi:hypothetical protein
MPKDSAAESPAATSSTPKTGDPVRFEGHAYVIDRITTARGAFEAVRPHGKGPKDSTYKSVVGEAKELVWSKKHEAWTLPGRGVHYHPATGVRLEPDHVKSDGSVAPLQIDHQSLTAYKKNPTAGAPVFVPDAV